MLVSPTSWADGEASPCCEEASHALLQPLTQAEQGLTSGEADGELEGAASLHRRMGGQIHPLNSRDEDEEINRISLDFGLISSLRSQRKGNFQWSCLKTINDLQP